MTKAKKTKRETPRKPQDSISAPGTTQKVVTIVKARGEPDEVTVQHGNIVLTPKSKEDEVAKETEKARQPDAAKPQRPVTDESRPVTETKPARVKRHMPSITGSNVRISKKTPRLA